MSDVAIIKYTFTKSWLTHTTKTDWVVEDIFMLKIWIIFEQFHGVTKCHNLELSLLSAVSADWATAAFPHLRDQVTTDWE